MMSCESYIETVETDLTLTSPHTPSTRQTPPVVHDETAKYETEIDDSMYEDRFMVELQRLRRRIVYGQDGVPPKELLNATRLHARHQELPQFTGTLRDPNRIRLVQSTVSTRLLEVLLGLMLLAAGAAVWAIDMKRTLPKNPCSIGVVVSLLAGSKAMLDEGLIPIGSEWLNDRSCLEGVFLLGSCSVLGGGMRVEEEVWNWGWAS
ncbi:hypothetical protein N7532_003565 [Penicillium argentinense]|uniref:Uncharacterized protein n=1 Tax=Penicillium argentinense TaxID=1131581 RepID=A0A9W9KEN0_9EURO|nr:uncharacterized protein N7532_003565 [Penicillium argentinense]KAJ5103036.1 hypothetical protein N7532_003565 [Penicillium argentinense]